MNKKKRSFKEEQAYWYGKLAQKGFDDIEDNNDMLKVWSSSVARAFKEPQAEYYRLASQFLYDYKWDCKENELIWHLHSEGFSLTRISIRTGIKRATLQHRIEKIRKIFLDTLKQG